ncbi:MAG: 5-bromo-4-chloroindolyl phosphate hydrolysis family protein [Lachnospiraceae bacterium]
MGMGEWFDAGSEILDAVSDAVDRADFSRLGDTVNDSLRRAFGTGTTGRAAAQPPKKNYFLVRNPSRNEGTSKKILGIVGEVFTGTMTIFNLVGLAAVPGVGVKITFLVLTAITFGLFLGCRKARKDGDRKNSLISRYYRYGELLGPGKEFFAIRDMAALSGESEDQVRNDIDEMKRAGYLPYAMFDANRTTVMLTNDAYLLYKKAEEARKQREETQRTEDLKNGIRQSQEAAEMASGASSEAAKILSEGETYIREIRAANDQIPDTDHMSDKLYELEAIVRKIFEEVRQHPEKAPNIRKMLSYYLPTTQKLLDAYVSLYRQPQTENIAKTRHEIEDAMDAILSAYGKIFDGLFQDEAWDIASDISVMKTVMAQDGLTDGVKNTKKTNTEQKQKMTAASSAADGGLDEGVDEGEENPLHFG